RVDEDRHLKEKDDQIGDEQPSHPGSHAEHSLRAHLPSAPLASSLLFPRAHAPGSPPTGRYARTTRQTRSRRPVRPAGAGSSPSFRGGCSPPSKRCPRPPSTGSQPASIPPPTASGRPPSRGPAAAAPTS